MFTAAADRPGMYCFAELSSHSSVAGGNSSGDEDMRVTNSRKVYLSLSAFANRRIAVSQNAIVFPLLLITVSGFAAADETLPAGAIAARDVFLRIKDAADLPALERGQLKRIVAEPGDRIEPGQLLAELDDVEAGLNLELARIELDIADRQHRESAAVPISMIF